MLQLEGVGARRGRREVLRDVSLSVAPGEVVAVIGPNGAGKSTLLDVAGGALPPTTGTVRRDGRVATALQAGDLARRSVVGNVTAALAWWGVARPEREPRARAALQALGVGDLADRPATQLSGGERRRVHLARALAVRPDLLLLDEPFSGLDPLTRGALLRDAARVLPTAAGAVVVVVHDRAEAWALASRLVVVIEGRVVADGPPQALLEAPPTVEVARFLGWTGELHDGDALLLTRPHHARLGAGEPATVVGRLAREDGVLLDLRTGRGPLQALVGYPGPQVGDEVAVELTGGVRLAPAAR